MPRQTRVGFETDFQLDAPNHFCRDLGLCFITWKSIELGMYCAFRSCLPKDQHRTALIIWNALLEPRRQFNALNEILEERFNGSPQLKKWQSISGRLGTAIKQRNHLAHWSFAAQPEFMLFPTVTNPANLELIKKGEKYTLRRLSGLTRTWAALQIDLAVFLNEVGIATPWNFGAWSGTHHAEDSALHAPNSPYPRK